MEVYGFKALGLHYQRKIGKCALADMDKSKE